MAHRALALALALALASALTLSECSHVAGAPALSEPLPPITRLTPGVSARIDALMRRSMADQNLPGVSLAIGRRDGTILYASGFGLRDVPERAFADRNTVYNVASITKQFTAAAILLLVQEHRLSIADSVTRYLPGFSNASSVTLRDLLAQTSGIPDYFYLPGYRAGMTAEAAAGLALEAAPRFRPGSRYEYSNTNFVLLGLIVQKVAGESYEAFVGDRLLKAAHMTSSRIGDVPGSGSDDAIAYATHGGAFEPVAAVANDLAFGAGALDATAPDLVRWACALFSGRILNREQTRRMLEPRLELPGSTVRYNYGVRERAVAGSRELYHRGRNAGYGGLLATFPADGVTIALLANSERLAPMYLAGEIHALVSPARKLQQASQDTGIAGDAAVDARAKRCLQDLAAAHVDRTALSPDAAARYSDGAVRDLAAGLRRFGALRSLALEEVDARYEGLTYTYRARFAEAIAEYRFGLDRDGKVWNLAVDRED